MMRMIFLVLLNLLLMTLLAVQADNTLSEDGLSTALRMTMRHHPAIKGKLSELAAQGFNVKSAKAGRLPSLLGQIEKLEDDKEYGTLVVRQPIWAFGKINRPINRARELFQTEELALLQVQRQLLEQTAAAYAKLQGIRQQLGGCR